MKKILAFKIISIFLLIFITSCNQQQIHSGTANPIQSAFVIQGETGNAIARVLTKANSCPTINFDGKVTAMNVRVVPGTIAIRGGSKQEDNKEAAFPILVCESKIPEGAKQAHVDDIELKVPHSDIKRIVIIADTGCRMKGSENAFQPCNDSQAWPFAQVAKSAAAKKPDLVIHIGDIHYRESPCPSGNTGCANSPWGYGYDVWNADLFTPARPLLNAAPWLFVRGNHESCARAGQGWFRFIDKQPWTEARSCNDPALDSDADFTDPFALSIAADTQLIIFDSSKAGAKAYKPSDEGYQKYIPQLKKVGELAKQAPHNFFLSHHPVLAFKPTKNPDVFGSGSEGLLSVMNKVYPTRLFPDEVDVSFNGHIHLFESLSFRSNHPANLILGNAGSEPDSILPQHMPAEAQPAPGAIVENFLTRSEYGFATLDRTNDGWQLTEWDINGNAVFYCDIHGTKSVCRDAIKK